MRALVLAACLAIAGCHGDPVGDFSGDSSPADTSASDSATTEGSAHDSTTDGDGATPADSTTDAAVDSSADAPVDVVLADSGADCGTHPGPRMIEISVADAGRSFCIDSTEVTVGQYAAFVADPTGFTPKCPGHDYTAKPTSASPDDHPVAGVDWCDAYDYCQWAGKRLCGNIYGGSILPAQYADLSRSQWYYACSNGTGTPYPYGSPYDSTKCAGESTSSTVTVGSLPGCHGIAAPFDALFDMSGNVAEWEDGCDAPIDAGAACPSRGGWVGETAATMRCDDNSSQFATETNDNTGFRCCSR